MRSEDSRPLFSIITATLNSADSVDGLAQSVAAQTHRDFEWIIQDGGSMDETVTIVGRLLDARASIVRQSDTGIYQALNRGVERSMGRYLIFMGADDVLHDPHVLENIAGIIEHCPSQATVILGSCEYRESGRVVTSKLSGLSWLVNTIHHQAAAYPREIFADFRYPEDVPVAGDYALTLHVLNRGTDVCLTDLRMAICSELGISKRSSEWKNYIDMYRLRRRYASVVWSGVCLAGGILNLGRRRLFP